MSPSWHTGLGTGEGERGKRGERGEQGGEGEREKEGVKMKVYVLKTQGDTETPL